MATTLSYNTCNWVFVLNELIIYHLQHVYHFLDYNCLHKAGCQPTANVMYVNFIIIFLFMSCIPKKTEQIEECISTQRKEKVSVQGSHKICS